MNPPVGIPRLYADAIGVLYPGERASAVIDGGSISALADRGLTEIAVTQWLVEPDPGVLAAYRRWRYRLIGQFVNRLTGGRPKMDVRIGDGR